MRQFRMAVLAGAATLLVTGAAWAASSPTHEMKLSLPDGSVAHIRYEGDVAPVVEVAPATDPVALRDPFDLFGPSPFAAFDQISALIDRQAAAMMQQAMTAGTDGAPVVTTGAAPAGTVHYSFVSTSSSNGSCTQSVEWRSDGSGAEPKMIRTSSGDCGADGQGDAAKSVTTSAPSPKATQVDKTI